MRIFNGIVLGQLLSSIVLLAQSSTPDHIPGRLIIHHNGSAQSPAAARLLARHGATLHRRIDKLNVSVVDVTPGSEEAVMQSLRGNPDVGEVEFDYYARPAGNPNDPNFLLQWHLNKIQAPAAWSSTTGSAAPIAVIDSGVDATHPDLASRIIAGWNFVGNNSNTTDLTGHGTAVAGTLGAVSNNGVGVAGVTWQNPIMPLVTVDSNNYASYSNIAAAIQYAADHGAKIINISLGGPSASSVLQSAVNYAWNAGAVVVASAMNNGNATPAYPAACANVIAVSATDENDNLAGFSDYGSWITLSAPGNNIETLTNGGGYGMWWGTSFAAPVVSGVAALALAANPGLTPQALVTLLEQNADDLGAPGFDSSYGWGRINAARAVGAALNGNPGGSAPPPTPAPAPPAPAPAPAPAPSVSVPVHMNAGGGVFTDGSGQAWSADSNFSGGQTWSTGINVLQTIVPALYQTCRYGNFNYTYTVPNGTYTVTLKFAEIALGGPNQRQFNVMINGSTVLSNFDVYAQAGGPFIAIDRAFPVTVAGGQILIQFTSGSTNLAMVNGIAIDAGAPTTTQSTVLLNAGGSAYTDSGGRTWGTDLWYSGGIPWSTGQGIANTSTPALYQTCRYGPFSYNLSVPNGTYTVTLKFAEIALFGAGQRLFNVSINGTPVLSNFDVYTAAGGSFKAIDKSFPVAVTGGVIAIQFTIGGANLPLVNAIQVVPGTTTAATVSLNSGAGAYTDSTGLVWAADNSFTGGFPWSIGAQIANTSTPAVYQTCRFGNFSYNFAVANGNYTVTLKFAEIADLGIGKRAFNVAINGVTLLRNFDVYAQAGGMFVALDKPFPITVTGGQIKIDFTSGSADLPFVNAVLIVPAP